MYFRMSCTKDYTVHGNQPTLLICCMKSCTTRVVVNLWCLWRKFASSHVALPPGLWQSQGVGPNTEVGSEVLQRVTKHILRPTCHATGAGELRVFYSYRTSTGP